MKKTYEFKNEKYNIIGYTLSNDKDSTAYKTDIVFGYEDYRKWILNVNGKDIAFYNTGNNIVNSDHVIVLGDELNIITDFDYFKIDLNTFKCLSHIELDDFDGVTCTLIKYKNGFLIHMDLSLVYIENDKVIWNYDSAEVLDKIDILDNNIIKVTEINYNDYVTYYLDSNGKHMKKLNN